METSPPSPCRSGGKGVGGLGGRSPLRQHPPNPRDAEFRKYRQADVPLDSGAGRVLRFQLADRLDVDATVLQPHDSGALAELDGVDAGGGRAGRALDLGIADEVVDDQWDTVVEEGSLPEGVDVGLEQVAAGSAQAGELPPGSLREEEGVRLTRLDQVDQLVHQVECQDTTVRAGGE